jgi:hypothetical protein
LRSPARYGGINLRLCFFTTDVIVLVSKPIELSSEDSQLFSDVELTDDEDVCCVCNKWQPIEIRDVVGVVFVKWGECSVCSHWTHLTYCT